MDTDVELVAPLDRFMNQAELLQGLRKPRMLQHVSWPVSRNSLFLKNFRAQYSNMQCLKSGRNVEHDHECISP